MFEMVTWSVLRGLVDLMVVNVKALIWLAARGIWFLIPTAIWFTRRINRQFETQKDQMARAFRDPKWLSCECERCGLKRFYDLWRLLGSWRAVSLVLQNPCYGRCKHYDGVEKRHHPGTWRDRSPAHPTNPARRFYDDPALVARIMLTPARA